MYAILGILLFLASAGTLVIVLVALSPAYVLLPFALFLASVYCGWKATWGRIK